MTTPMLQALRRLLPRAHVTVVAGTQASASVVEGSPLCDDVRVMAPGKMSPPALLWRFSRFRGFDAAIVGTRLSPRIGQLLRLCARTPIVAGDCDPPRRWGYTHWRAVDPEMPRVFANLTILRTILPEAEVGPLYFHRDEPSRIRADRVWSSAGLDGRLVLGVHVGSSSPVHDKRFPAENCRAFLIHFLERFPDARVMVFFGPDEADIVPVFSALDERIIVQRDLTLPIVAGLISKTQVFVAGDTGFGHVAASVGVPTVTLAGPTFIASTHPWHERNVIVSTSEQLPCMPCFGTDLYGRCPYQVRCMTGIQSEDILDVVTPHFVSRAAGPPRSLHSVSSA